MSTGIERSLWKLVVFVGKPLNLLSTSTAEEFRIIIGWIILSRILFGGHECDVGQTSICCGTAIYTVQYGRCVKATRLSSTSTSFPSTRANKGSQINTSKTNNGGTVTRETGKFIESGTTGPSSSSQPPWKTHPAARQVSPTWASDFSTSRNVLGVFSSAAKRFFSQSVAPELYFTTDLHHMLSL